MKEFRPARGTPCAKMVLAATVCILLALVALVNIEAWRRRTVAEMRAVERRTAARERAWEAVNLLEREAA